MLRGEIVFPGQTETGISGKIRNIVAAGSFVLVGVWISDNYGLVVFNCSLYSVCNWNELHCITVCDVTQEFEKKN